LEQLTAAQLHALLDRIDGGGPICVDHGNYDPGTGAFCPLAVAVGLDRAWRGEASSDRVGAVLSLMGYSVGNTRGVAGEFFRGDRRGELREAAEDVLRDRANADVADWMRV
jgi:hypothetical protein